jgi:formylglycine-generating enzyme required for sulfatase activity/predicted Ser/Thr protein kinase
VSRTPNFQDQKTLPARGDGDGERDSDGDLDLEAQEVLRAVAHAPPRRPSSTVVPGMRWGDADRFIIERRIGRGGMGTVYAATDSVLGRIVALKVLDAAVTQQDAAHHAPLLREARLAARAEHERIARVYDVGMHDGLAFVAMEYVQGGTLRQWMTGRDVPLAEIVDIATQIAEGLAELHAKEVVHRDLKPENVMLTKQRGVKLLDFGLARYTVRTAEDIGLAARAVLLDGVSLAAASGTPGYMAPEQCAGEPIDARADVFALGVILYELITGERLFRGASLDAILRATLAWVPVLRGEPWSRLPAQLRDIIARMLARDPAQRFADGGAVLGALRDLDLGAPAPGLRLAPAIAQPFSKAPTQPAPARPRSWGVRRGLARRGLELSCVIAAGLFLLAPRPSQRTLAPAPRGMARINGGAISIGRDERELDRECALIGAECERDQMLRETPRAVVTVAPFFLDQREVTNQQFADMLNDFRANVDVADDPDDHYPRVVSGKARFGHDGPWIDLSPKRGGIEYTRGVGYRARAGRENLPAVQISWQGAMQYCESVGKRLPTEDEWEAAARGLDDRRFPWGQALPRCGDVVIPNDGELVPSAWQCPKAAVLRAVGRAPQDVTPEGVHDLAGNVTEWTASWYGPGNRATPPKAGKPRDARVIRGGSWAESLMARTSGRNRLGPEVMAANIGFRCASNADDASL